MYRVFYERDKKGSENGSFFGLGRGWHTGYTKIGFFSNGEKRSSGCLDGGRINDIRKWISPGNSLWCSPYRELSVCCADFVIFAEDRMCLSRAEVNFAPRFGFPYLYKRQDILQT